MKHIKIEGNFNLVKDFYSKAILNTNKEEILQYNKKINNEYKMLNLENEVKILKKQLNMITNFLINNRAEKNNNVN